MKNKKIILMLMTFTALGTLKGINKTPFTGGGY